MRLYYCDHLPNFGDRLNAWLWPRVLPQHIDAHSDNVLIGVGTLLNCGMAPWATKLVLGAGAPSHDTWHLDGTWRVYGVRGPLTARALDLPATAALSDPAVLVPLLRSAAPKHRNAVATRAAFMPHHLSSRLGRWGDVCEQPNISYVDPAAPVEDVINAIANCTVLITEALHGAIVADALRVPWVPVQMYTHINAFKWQDWCTSLGMSYAPQFLPPLWNGVKSTKPYASTRMALKRTAASLGWWHKRWRPLHPTDSTQAECDFIAQRLDSLACGEVPVMLSQATLLLQAQVRLQEAIARVKRDWPVSVPDVAPTRAIQPRQTQAIESGADRDLGYALEAHTLNITHV